MSEPTKQAMKAAEEIEAECLGRVFTRDKMWEATLDTDEAARIIDDLTGLPGLMKACEDLLAWIESLPGDVEIPAEAAVTFIGVRNAAREALKPPPRESLGFNAREFEADPP
jgi:hypothetical protein